MTVAPTPIHPRRESHRSQWMLVAILVLLAGLALSLLFQFDVFGGSSTSSVEGSGVSATQARDVEPFGSLELAGSNNVTVHVGKEQSVLVHGDDNLLDRVTTEVHAGTLVVGNATHGSFSTKSPMSVDVSVPSLTALTLTGSGNISFSDVKAQRLTVMLSGSGTLTGTGTATRLEVTVSGSGAAQLEQLVANDVQALVSGFGDIFVTATNSLDAAVRGAGVIVYGGDPQEVTKSVTGSGAITAR